MRDILLLLIVAGTIPFCLRSPYIALMGWTAFSLGTLYELSWGFFKTIPWVQIYAIMTFGVLAAHLNREKFAIPKTAAIYLLFFFFLWTFFCQLFAVNSWAAEDGVEKFFKIFLHVLLLVLLTNTKERIHLLMLAVALSMGIWGLKSGLWTLSSGGGANIRGPGRSFITDNNTFGLALLMTVPFCWYFVTQATRLWHRVLAMAGTGLTFIGVLGTYSRGALIGLVVVGSVMLLRSRNRWLMLPMLVSLVLGLQFMPDRWREYVGILEDPTELALQADEEEGRALSTLDQRLLSWGIAFDIAKDNPITGAGFGAVLKLYPAYNTTGYASSHDVHSIYFEVLSETGFVGIIAFLSMHGVALLLGNATRRRTARIPEMRWAYDAATCLQLANIAYLTAGAALGLAYYDFPYVIVVAQACLWRVAIEECAALQESPTDAVPDKKKKNLGPRVPPKRKKAPSYLAQ